jgi:hypothetical protein
LLAPERSVPLSSGDGFDLTAGRGSAHLRGEDPDARAGPALLLFHGPRARSPPTATSRASVMADPQPL